MPEDNKDILIARENPLTLVLKLPDGISAGRLEAARAFAGHISEIQEHYPGKAFQFVPFSYQTVNGYESNLTVMLAIATPSTAETENEELKKSRLDYLEDLASKSGGR